MIGARGYMLVSAPDGATGQIARPLVLREAGSLPLFTVIDASWAKPVSLTTQMNIEPAPVQPPVTPA